jgi:hypothetical protein
MRFTMFPRASGRLPLSVLLLNNLQAQEDEMVMRGRTLKYSQQPADEHEIMQRMSRV